MGSISCISIINSFPPSAAYMRQWTASALLQIMACRLFGAKPLSKPMIGYCKVDPYKQNSVKFQSKYKTFRSRKCVWKDRLRNGGHFVQGWWVNSGEPFQVKRVLSMKNWEHSPSQFTISTTRGVSTEYCHKNMVNYCTICRSNDSNTCYTHDTIHHSGRFIFFFQQWL